MPDSANPRAYTDMKGTTAQNGNPNGHIQHPGETTKYTTQWPNNAGYGLGKRPRSSTIVITKNDGGKVGT